jgi:hypothetical protein
MSRKYTREQLEAKTARELKNLCVYDLHIPGMTKKRKDVIIDAILELHGRPVTKVSLSKPEKGPMKAIEFTAQSTITKPGAPFGHKTTTTVHVSCGASSGNFPVAGRTVKEIGEFLREVLNVDRLSTGLVNGKTVDGDYVVKPGDNLEFLKPAGKKGC